MKEIHIIVSGKVQGIFFRATVKEIAEDFKLNGYAKNLKDGSVEIVAQGLETSLEELLKEIKNSPGESQVEKCQSSLRNSQVEFSSFRIL